MPRPRSQNRASQEEIDAMPALVTVNDLSYVTGYTPVYVAKLCRCGIFRDCAVKTGTSWSINKAKALRALGLD